MSIDVKAAVAEAMQADAMLMALLPGGVYTVAEISRTMEPPTPFDEVGRVRPSALVRNEASSAVGPRKRFSRHFVLVFFYAQAGYGVIDAALERTQVLLHERRLGGGAYQLWNADVVPDQYDDALLAYMHRARFEVTRLRN